MLFIEQLVELGACTSALMWVGPRTMQEAYTECTRVNWLAWFFREMIGVKGWPTYTDICLAVDACWLIPTATRARNQQAMCDVLRERLLIPE